MSRPKKSDHYREKMITLMSISPRTVVELCGGTGCSDTYIRKEIIKLKDLDLCYIATYRKHAHGFSALFAYGQGTDVQPPHWVQKQKFSRSARKKNEQDLPGDSLQKSIGEKVSCYGGIWGLA